MKFKEGQFRTDLDRLFELSPCLSASKLSHYPFIVFHGDSIELVDNAYDLLLLHPPETQVLVQWGGEWRSDFFPFKVSDLHNYLLTHTDRNTNLRGIVERSDWKNEPARRKAKEEDAKRRLEEFMSDPCFYCGLPYKKWYKNHPVTGEIIYIENDKDTESECPKNLDTKDWKGRPNHRTKSDIEFDLRMKKEREEKWAAHLEREKIAKEKAKVRSRERYQLKKTKIIQHKDLMARIETLPIDAAKKKKVLDWHWKSKATISPEDLHDVVQSLLK